MTYDTVTLAMTDDRVATVTLNRPDRMNALSPQLFDDATAAIEQAVAGGAGAVVLTGAGGAFCAGADLTAAADPSKVGDTLERYYNPFTRLIFDLPVPVVTAINGPAVGAGLGIALLGDISIAARSSYLLLAFVGIGLVPDAGSSWLVAKAVGRAKALELALLGDRVSAEAAAEMGLVTRVVDDADCLPTAQALAARLARGPSPAVRLIRRQMNAALNLDLDAVLAMEAQHQGEAGRSADFMEGVTAFLQKRPPAFGGQHG
ncbi:2-(1,2-epoxy-1,2-dihydrophenyl)acetyl-CoA isomerase [Sphingomonas jejuensis]|uniref:2-(1,2-epoxy-1,2-dihydrophenyl)acetyl-CoA isomerase n=1 Tax=Sphingomonas jejuensis TaxID=904715 RepID=A0ABX0XIC8_9SPHN|nr:enoyl-CoA hydratase-related protein [Sphingomonas jejuensis]NJC32918.1 2-(1,2-epoxy-1,2-dihydrophenyl)acetyl-CoA isomerase [Sphingomonas jejuensis]